MILEVSLTVITKKIPVVYTQKKKEKESNYITQKSTNHRGRQQEKKREIKKTYKTENN